MHWAEKNIIEAIDNELMNGYDDGTFKPDKPVNRAELATVEVRLLRKAGK
ncbi:S-layer homology domain-containing protein [Vallitalea longa]|nr:S-layer homology domain-containing protein [Vallitalea longa]